MGWEEGMTTLLTWQLIVCAYIQNKFLKPYIDCSFFGVNAKLSSQSPYFLLASSEKIVFKCNFYADNKQQNFIKTVDKIGRTFYNLLQQIR